MRNKFPIVKVTWDDTTTYHVSWVEVKRLLDRKEYGIATIVNMGFLVHEDKDEIRIVNSLSDDGFCLGLTVIPAGYVKKIEVQTKKGWSVRRKARSKSAVKKVDIKKSEKEIEKKVKK